MDVCVLTADPGFFTVVHGLAGAMHHRAHRLDEGTSPLPGSLLVVDAHTPGTHAAAAGFTFDPVYAVAFAPLGTAAERDVRRAGISRVFARSTLADELPRLFNEFAV